MKNLLLLLGVFCLLISLTTACGKDEPQTQKGIEKATEAAKEEPKGAIDAGIVETKETIEAAKEEAEEAAEKVTAKTEEAVEAGIQKTADVIESTKDKADDTYGDAQKEVEGFLNK